MGGQDTATGVLRAKLSGVLQLIYRHFPPRVRNPLQGGQYSEIKQLGGFEAVRPLHIYIYGILASWPLVFIQLFYSILYHSYWPQCIFKVLVNDRSS